MLYTFYSKSNQNLRKFSKVFISNLEKISMTASLHALCLAIKNTPSPRPTPKMVDNFFKASSCQALKQSYKQIFFKHFFFLPVRYTLVVSHPCEGNRGVQRDPPEINHLFQILIFYSYHFGNIQCRKLSSFLRNRKDFLFTRSLI